MKGEKRPSLRVDVKKLFCTFCQLDWRASSGVVFRLFAVARTRALRHDAHKSSRLLTGRAGPRREAPPWPSCALDSIDPDDTHGNASSASGASGRAPPPARRRPSLLAGRHPLAFGLCLCSKRHGRRRRRQLPRERRRGWRLPGGAFPVVVVALLDLDLFSLFSVSLDRPPPAAWLDGLSRARGELGDAPEPFGVPPQAQGEARRVLGSSSIFLILCSRPRSLRSPPLTKESPPPPEKNYSQATSTSPRSWEAPSSSSMTQKSAAASSSGKAPRRKQTGPGERSS